MTTTPNILEEALRATDGAEGRPKAYGHPYDHFGRTVGAINATFTDIVRERLARGEPMFTRDDWPVMMILDKTARYVHEHQRDSLVDIPGYARTAEMVNEERARRGVVHAAGPSKGNGHDVGVDARARLFVHDHALDACPEAAPQGDGHPG